MTAAQNYTGPPGDDEKSRPLLRAADSETVLLTGVTSDSTQPAGDAVSLFFRDAACEYFAVAVTRRSVTDAAAMRLVVEPAPWPEWWQATVYAAFLTLVDAGRQPTPVSLADQCRRGWDGLPGFIRGELILTLHQLFSDAPEIADGVRTAEMVSDLARRQHLEIACRKVGTACWVGEPHELVELVGRVMLPALEAVGALEPVPE